jgi:hypothetical protein
VPAPVAPCPGNSSDIRYDFQSANFTLWRSNLCSPGGSPLVGFVLEPKGTLDRFTFGDVPATSLPMTWISPDRLFGVQWGEGANVSLLAEAL